MLFISSCTCFVSPPSKNVAIATSVAASVFTGTERTEAVSVPLFYGIVEAVLIGIYCVFAWKMGWTKAPADEKFCIVIAKTYEVPDFDEESMIAGSKIGPSNPNRMHRSDTTVTTDTSMSDPRKGLATDVKSYGAIGI